MLTPITLRSLFKIDTGEYPVWFDNNRYKKNYGTAISFLKKHTSCSNATFIGNPKTIYGQWLEEKLGNKHELRMKYKYETGKSAINPLYSHNSKEKFTLGYSFWLEELYISIHNLMKEHNIC